MKIGDEVVVKGDYGTLIWITRISGESKKDWILTNGWKFSKQKLWRQVPGIYPYTIEKATQEHKNHLRKKELLEKMDAVKWYNLSLEQLEEINKIITCEN